MIAAIMRGGPRGSNHCERNEDHLHHHEHNADDEAGEYGTLPVDRGGCPPMHHRSQRLCWICCRWVISRGSSCVRICS